MIRNTPRKARKRYRCSHCFAVIQPGDRYLDSWMSPDHDGLGYKAWMHGRECFDCAHMHGRSDIFVSAVSS